MTAKHEIALRSARGISRAVRSGELTATAVTEAFLEVIANKDGPIMAFEHLGSVKALDAARAIDAKQTKGLLAGIPVGVKDIIDTQDMPTGYGSEAYRGFRPPWDAPCVAMTKEADGIILGKTVATEFAMTSPNRTRNPLSLNHTPGGSSSGSCAAVAAGMVRLAFATQTSGSVIRPASFCGVVGYKPSFGLLNRVGIKLVSDSLDTLGIISRDVGDCAWCTAVLARNAALAVPENNESSPLRVAVFKTSRWSQADACSQQAVEYTAGLLSRNTGLTVTSIAVPDWFDELFHVHDAIMGWEVTQSLAYERLQLADRITSVTRTFLAEKAQVTLEQYWRARQQLSELRTRFAAMMDGTDALLTLATVGEAPKGMPTGDPLFNKAWTMLHVPCLTMPALTGPNGLPIGIQLVGRMNDDKRLLATASHVEQFIRRKQP